MNTSVSFTGTRALTLVLSLAVISVVGIVGMLLTGPAWDWALLLLAAMPLVVGIKLAKVVKRSDSGNS